MSGPAVVFAKEVSDGAKIGPVSATYVSQRTCPRSCPFLGEGCYAENGAISMVATRRLNRATPDDMTPEQIARLEARKIDGLTGKRDLRLHVVGDSPTYAGTLNIATAAESYMRRGGRRVWTYTHAWRTVERAAWGDVSVLASCETPEEVREANALGYAAAIVVENHGTAKRYTMAEGVQVLPCPEQTRGVTCAECRICTDDKRLLREGIAVGFRVHGSGGATGGGSRGKAARTLAAKRPAKVRGCSIGWCGNSRERWCSTCARPFCGAHQCDDHEVRGKAYETTNRAKGVRDYAVPIKT